MSIEPTTVQERFMIPLQPSIESLGAEAVDATRAMRWPAEKS